MCLPTLIEIVPHPHKPHPSKRSSIRPIPSHQTDRIAPEHSSPSPCIITISPRNSPRSPYSPENRGIRLRGEASPKGLALRVEREGSCASPPKPRGSPSPKPPVCQNARKGRRGSASSSSSSSSSSLSSSNKSFRELKEKVEQLLKRCKGLEDEVKAGKEKELQKEKEREKAGQEMKAEKEREEKIQREVGGLQDKVQGLGREVEGMRREVFVRRRREEEVRWGLRGRGRG